MGKKKNIEESCLDITKQLYQSKLFLGTDLEVTAGPIGRDISAQYRVGDGGNSPCLSYSHSVGLFAGDFCLMG